MRIYLIENPINYAHRTQRHRHRNTKNYTKLPKNTDLSLSKKLRVFKTIRSRREIFPTKRYSVTLTLGKRRLTIFTERYARAARGLKIGRGEEKSGAVIGVTVSLISRRRLTISLCALISVVTSF